MTQLSICFFDYIAWDYDVSTPLSRPLGGSQSAMCYLAVELARRGHRVVLYNDVQQSGTVMGVDCVARRHNPAKAYFARHQFDAIVVVNGPAFLSGLKLDLQLTPRTTLALWTGHPFDQPWMQFLAQPDMRDRWDRIVCVSDWHRRTMIETYALDPGRVAVRRNAMSPAFENLFHSAADLAAAKSGPPRLVYSSPPGRGLDVLLSLFPRLAAACELEIYSSFKVYQVDEAEDEYRPLYEAARRLPRVSYSGAVSQTELAARTRRAAILSYPATVPETSCITVIEALAAGLLVVTSDLGGLPETAMGFGELVGGADPATFAERYLAKLSGVLQRAADGVVYPAEAAFRQVQAVNATCRWAQRAAEWEEMIAAWSSAAG